MTTTSTTIESVRTRLLSIPLEKPLLTAAFPIPAIDTALVQVRTAGGHEGVAWSFAFGRGRVASLVRLVEDLGSLIVGADALRTEALWRKMTEAVAFLGKKGMASLAISTLDTACWDIVGKAAELPIHQLLGGYDPRVPVYASQGLWLDRSREDLAQEAASLVDAGFTAMKMRMGLADEREDIARVHAVRSTIGPDVKLMADVNQAWDLKQTLRMADRLDEFDLFWLEEPMPFHLVDDYAAATARIPMMMCTGESNYLKDEIHVLLAARATDLVMPDLMRMAGVTEWLKAARLCETYGIPVTPHLFMEHSSHLAGASSNVVWQEFQPWWQPIMANPVELDDGAIVLADTPGFGIALDEAAVREFELR